MSSGSFMDGVLGGLGLFLLGAWLLAEGLAQAFGPRLRAWWLARGDERFVAWSSGALLGLGSPLSETSSRSIAGLANTGVLQPVHLLWCAAGHVAGPAALAWLFVTLAGTTAGDAFALALVAGGVAALWTAPDQMRGAIGRALAGAGLLLFGMDLVAGGFEHVRGVLRLDGFPGGLLIHSVALAIVGAAFTAGLRSASATVVLAAAAARSGALETTSAVAMAFGALLASAWGALLALESGTLAARRAALGVIAVHVLAALGGAGLALGLGPALQNPPGFLADPARTIALLLTLVPLVPVLALYFLDRRLVSLCEHRFRADEHDELAPHFIDANLRGLAPMAFEALLGEVRRLHAVARRLAVSVLVREPVTGRRENTDRAVLRSLAQAIEDGSAQLARRALDAHSAAALPAVARAVQASWELGEQSAWLHAEGHGRGGPLGAELESRLHRVQLELARLLDTSDPGNEESDAFTPARAEQRLVAIEGRLRDLRAAATQRCTSGELSPQDLENSMERLATLRRMAQLAVDSTADLVAARAPRKLDFEAFELDEQALQPRVVKAPLR